MHLEPKLSNSETQNREQWLNKWFMAVDAYQNFFYEHPSLPNLLKQLARFDIIAGTSKGTRPPSRVLNIKNLEDRPDAIRAIPWGRAFLLAGIHTEAIGAGVFSGADAIELSKQYRNNFSFSTYVKHIAYALARTDMELAWMTLLDEFPEQHTIDLWKKKFRHDERQPPQYLLAWIHEEIYEAKRFVYKSIYGEEPTNRYQILVSELLAPWPALRKEVEWREKEAIPYKFILRYTRKNAEMVKRGEFVRDFFTGCLTLFNTDVGIYHPEAVQNLIWE